MSTVEQASCTEQVEIKITLFRHVCQQCLRSWVTDLEHPGYCRYCKSPNWTKPAKYRKIGCTGPQSSYVGQSAGAEVINLRPATKTKIFNTAAMLSPIFSFYNRRLPTEVKDYA